MESTAAQRKLVIVLFVLVLVVFFFAERDSKQLDKFYTLMPGKKENVAVVKTSESTTAPVK